MDSVNAPILSFVVLDYKEEHLLRLNIERLLSLRLAEHGIPFEIIIVDNRSSEDFSSKMRRLYPQAHVVYNGKNLGHPAGNNRGLALASGTYIVMINPDLVVTQVDDLRRIVAYMDAHPDVGILGPKLYNPDGTIQMSCYRKYSRFTPIFRRTFLGKFFFAKKDIARHLMLDDDHSQTKDVEWLLGACFVIRRSAMETVGMMDEDFFLYFGDYDWCDRMHDHGYRTVYFAETSGIIHYHKRESASSKFSLMQVLSPVTRIHLKDWMTYVRKHSD
ncbi:MAG: glycosyltransferase family 2 protein [Candidatus Kerfeldbacteria bacterium]|nr:glycosyltransferase family 2 protein [Candidatus Kerfeldbacteria bacterium]